MGNDWQTGTVAPPWRAARGIKAGVEIEFPTNSISLSCGAPGQMAWGEIEFPRACPPRLALPHRQSPQRAERQRDRVAQELDLHPGLDPRLPLNFCGQKVKTKFWQRFPAAKGFGFEGCPFLC